MRISTKLRMLIQRKSKELVKPLSYSEIAKQFGVSKTTVYYQVNGRKKKK